MSKLHQQNVTTRFLFFCNIAKDFHKLKQEHELNHLFLSHATIDTEEISPPKICIFPLTCCLAISPMCIIVYTNITAHRKYNSMAEDVILLHLSLSHIQTTHLSVGACFLLCDDTMQFSRK